MEDLYNDYYQNSVYGAINGGSDNEFIAQDSPIIGTLAEKTVHKYLKKYYEPNEQFHEKRIGKFVADIYANNKIIEVQTGAFNPLKEKLIYYFEKSIPVKVVCPVAAISTIFWIDKENGEITSKRKSPIKKDYTAALKQLSSLKLLLANPLLSIDIVLCEMDEYKSKIQVSRKNRRGHEKVDRTIERVVSVLSLTRKEDYLYFLPSQIVEDSEFFSASDVGEIFKKEKVPVDPWLVCYVLRNCNAIVEIDDTIKKELNVRKGTKVYKINKK
ncbi:MAG: hypothetical protein RR640_03950 [Oscillospiraceae bacterium]